MKYIRTKDGRIINVSLMQECETDDDSNEDKRVFDGYEDKDGTYYPVENILKQADTIEELCDEFVYNKMIFKTLKEVLDYVPISALTNNQIRGAIWTDKGLIYVAKMNDKGELELL